MKRLLLHVLSCLPLCMYGQTSHPNEQWVRSLQGGGGLYPIQTGMRLRVHDPEANFILANQGTYTTRLDHRRSEAVVVLRYDDTRRLAVSGATALTVTYELVTRHLDGSVTVHPPASLTIDFDPDGPYTDIRARYTADVLWASLRVTDVQTTGFAPEELPDDVWLDLRLDVDRHYDLGPEEAPKFTAWPAMPPGDPSHLWVHWDYVEGAESYDLEWVFVDCIDFFGTAPINCSGNGLAYDFTNATRVNVTGNRYEIPLAYPRGWLVLRARAVGREAADGTREEGPWNLAEQVPPDIGTLPDLHRYQVSGLDNDRNWTYQAGYAEQGLRKEVLSFFDGSLRPRQSLTLLNTDGLGLLDNKVYDALGRPALTLLPYPVQDRVLGFKPGQLHDGTAHYGWEHFDTDALVHAPTPITGSTPAGSYYSTANTGLGVHGDLAPDAGGRPYARTVFWNDGTGRVREEAGPGPDHTMGSAHTTRYAYGTPGSQYELDRLFGNEAGHVQHYKKNTVTDPNGVTSVAYLDQHGRTIATALAGFSEEPAPHFPVDGYDQQEVEQLITTPLPSLPGPDNEWSVNRTFTLSTPTDLVLNYQLDPATHEQCVTGDCTYDISIRLLDDCGVEVPGGTGDPLPGPGSTQVTGWEFTWTQLPAGTYTLQKVLTVNTTALDQAVTEFIAEPCVPPPDVPVVECQPGCATLCEQAFTTEVDGILYYTDANGIPTTTVEDNGTNYDAGEVATALGAISECQALCEVPPMPDRCAVMLQLMTLDMSPGGQYFDNTPDPDDINGWLEDRFTTGPGELPAPLNTFSDWDELRANWQPGWATTMAAYHPERCAYEHYCNSGGRCGPELSGVRYSDYELLMFATEHAELSPTGMNNHLFNPLGIAQQTDPDFPATYQPVPLPTEAQFDVDVFCWNQATFGFVENGDPQVGVNDCIPTDHVATQLLNFAVGASPPGAYSIWSVINGEDLAHDPLSPTTIAPNVLAFLQRLHGTYDGDPDALINDDSPGPGQVTKYQFFRGVYFFYRELSAYLVYDGGCSGTTMACAPFLSSPDNNGYTAEGFLIRYPRNPIFDNWEDHLNDPDFFADTFIPAQETVLCATNCEAAADAQLAALQPCGTGVTTNCYELGDADCIRQALIAVCQLDCPMGSSLGDGINGVSPCGGTVSLGSFQDVLDLYLVEGTATAIEHPAPQPHEEGDAPTAQCACQGLHDFIAAQPPGATDTEIMDALEELRGDELTDTWDNLTTTLDTWRGLCDDDPLNEGAIAAAAFPSIFACPVFSVPGYDCQQEAQTLAQYNADQQWAAQLQEAAQDYRTAMAATCLGGLAQRETFTMQYTLGEYHYMLYFYDQAGNLVKTVPPNGVGLDLANDYAYEVGAGEPAPFTGANAIAEFSAAVAAHRATPHDPNTPFIRPGHGFATWYTYNSFQQPVAQFQPDGGITRFFYDKLGRLIASQDAVQAGNGRYSYTLYDDLGRVTEVGQLVSPEPLDQETARDEGEAPIATWADFLAQITAKEQITRTYYTTPLEELDIDLAGVTGSFGTAGQQHLRNRVVATTFLEQPSNPGQEPPVDEYDQATHYSYDIHGNVRSLVQEIGELHQVGQGFKRMDYRYDLVSGKVLEVNYQHGQWDQFHHRYRYDADGRLLEARTSSDGRIWERDARYLYYAHGPLARTELGDKQVQGTDHYYTLHGWLRGVNTPTLDRTLDPGTDGVAPGRNGFFGEDANSYALAYYSGDFNPVGGNTTMLPDEGTGAYATVMSVLSMYNGNIPSMLTALRDPDGLPMPLHANMYGYDRLNRIKATGVLDGAATTDLGTLTPTADYLAEYNYDPNGNLLNLKRNAHGTNQAMDDLSYSYLPGTNKLDHVHDAVDDEEWPDDLDEQGPENYDYDVKGRLTQDKQADIIGTGAIHWTLHDKVRAVTRDDGSTMPDLHFRYGATGQRTIKEVRPRDGSGDPLNEANWTTTYYTHDAQGNPMAIYRREYEPQSGGGDAYYERLYVEGRPIYGSGRLGLEQRKRVYFTEFTTTGFDGGLRFIDRDYTTMPSPWADDMLVRRDLGYKQYELANHLGNVLTTVSDRKIAVPDAGSPDQVDYYTADIVSVNDYYPFGLLKPGRNFNSSSSRFLFQGQEHDDELHGATGTSYNYEYRMHDPRIGRFLSIDPLAADYPWNSPYAFSENRVIDGIELEGLEWQEKRSTNSDGSSEITDYEWSGYDNNGFANPGTVPSACLEQDGFKYSFSSNESTQWGTVHVESMVNTDNLEFKYVISPIGNAYYSVSEGNDEVLSLAPADIPKDAGPFTFRSIHIRTRVDLGLDPLRVILNDGITPDYTIEGLLFPLPRFMFGSRLLAWGANKSAFAGLSRAAEFGIGRYSALKRAVGKGSGLEVHHLIEQRFYSLFPGMTKSNGMSIVVTRAEHLAFTRAWLNAIPRGAGTANASAAQVRQIAKQIYKDYPEILQALGL